MDVQEIAFRELFFHVAMVAIAIPLVRAVSRRFNRKKSWATLTYRDFLLPHPNLQTESIPKSYDTLFILSNVLWCVLLVAGTPLFYLLGTRSIALYHRSEIGLFFPQDSHFLVPLFSSVFFSGIFASIFLRFLYLFSPRFDRYRLLREDIFHTSVNDKFLYRKETTGKERKKLFEQAFPYLDHERLRKHYNQSLYGVLSLILIVFLPLYFFAFQNSLRIEERRISYRPFLALRVREILWPEVGESKLYLDRRDSRTGPYVVPVFQLYLTDATELPLWPTTGMHPLPEMKKLTEILRLIDTHRVPFSFSPIAPSEFSLLEKENRTDKRELILEFFSYAETFMKTSSRNN